MKIFKLLVLLLIIVSSIKAQTIKTSNLKQIPVDNAYFPVFGNNQNQLFVTGPNYMGLTLHNIENNTTTEISNELGAGKHPVINNEGKVTYEVTQIIKGKKQTTNKVYQLNTLKTTNTTTEQNQLTVEASAKSILVNQNKNDYKLSPLGETYYIWASLSPNQDKILFTAVGKGTYTCSIDGTNLVKLGYLNTPKWLNNNWVVGMNDKDNGETIISSDIIAIYLPTLERTNLTSEFENTAIYPAVSSEGKRIAFNTPEGKVFVFDIEMTN